MQKKTFRFVNNNDLVPRVPFRGFDYADICQMIHFGANGQPQLQSLEWSNVLARTFQSFKDFFDIAGHVAPDVADHDMSGLRAFGPKSGRESFPPSSSPLRTLGHTFDNKIKMTKSTIFSNTICAVAPWRSQAVTPSRATTRRPTNMTSLKVDTLNLVEEATGTYSTINERDCRFKHEIGESA